MIDLELFKAARAGLKDIVVKTDLAYSTALSELSGCNIYLKQENLQKTGAYKIRGAFNRISQLSSAKKKRGVIAASAGNHAQGVAYSARHFGIRSVIVMPESTPLLKVVSTKSLGAEVIQAGGNFDEAYKFAINFAKEENLEFIHPFADNDVIVGQGTIALEMIETRNLDYVIVPVGGGGLISGISNVYKALSPKTKIIGVVAEGARTMFDSFKSKKAMSGKSVRTIADGIAVRDVNAKNLDLILECVDDIVMVNDEEIANAILFLLERQKLVVEGAGAVCVAAILHNKINFAQNANLTQNPSQKQNPNANLATNPKQNPNPNPNLNVGLILSGGNIDVTLLGVIIEKGLMKSHRKMQFKTILIDKPGSLQRLTETLSRVNANIINIDYNRISTILDYGDVIISIVLETKGLEHQNEIRAKLAEAGYKIDEFY